MNKGRRSHSLVPKGPNESLNPTAEEGLFIIGKLTLGGGLARVLGLRWIQTLTLRLP
jgi:hypothetical protein